MRHDTCGGNVFCLYGGAGAIATANGGAFLNFLPELHAGAAWTQAYYNAQGINGDYLHYNLAGHTLQADLFASTPIFKALLS